MCVFFHAPEGGTAVFYFVGGGRRRVPGLSTRLQQVRSQRLKDALNFC